MNNLSSRARSEEAATLAVDKTARELEATMAVPASLAQTPTTLPPWLESIDLDTRFLFRYEYRAPLGEGGMGRVDLYHDRAIGREVAIKRIREGDVHPVLLERFVREARVQGQLEHPAIVPVHDLARMPDGTVFFTMKRIRGETLDTIIDALASNDPEVQARYNRRRLLSAFATACLAVDFAHRHGILHRDLKPSNIMLGDFGEVYVLDWGLAKIQGAPGAKLPECGGETAHEALCSDSKATQQGMLLGTPGYMSPEQCRGEHDRLGPESDVYSLGCILFEILYLEPLHDGRTVAERIASTITGSALTRSRAQASEIPPELEQLWRAAVATEPANRLRSARELAERIERFLDGERDERRRHELASEHVRQALSIDGSTPEGRAAQMRELGRALALDPSHDGARRALAEALQNLPEAIPPAAQLALENNLRLRRLQMVHSVAIRLITWILVIPVVVGFGVKSWLGGGLLVSSLLLTAVLALFTWRKERVSDAWVLFLIFASALSIGLISLLFGPFVLVPTLAATNAVFFAMGIAREKRPYVLIANLLSVLLPVLFMALGIVPNPYDFVQGTMIIRSPLVYLPAGGVQIFLVLVSAAMVITPTLPAGR
ncbi:MAG: serine/threonine protein kinase, partial [Deltaproteobacteria bacterium]|nr:serine/threonine protein kinase [Deltaproteobacteria bacterium]